MKKIAAIILSVVIISTFAVVAFADGVDISAVTKYTPYSFFDAEGNFTEGVSLYSEGKKVPNLAATIGKGFSSGCAVQNSTGGYEYIVWTPGEAGAMTWEYNCRALQLCNPNPYIEVKFNGTGFRVGTTDIQYDGVTAKINIDGQDYTTETIPNGTVGVGYVVFEKTDLKAGNHTAKIYVATSEMTVSWFEVNGTLGESSADTADYTAAVVVAAVAAFAGVVLCKKKH